jgi:hypothetical protein
VADILDEPILGIPATASFSAHGALDAKEDPPRRSVRFL